MEPKPKSEICANVCQRCGEAIVHRRGDWDLFLVVHRLTCAGEEFEFVRAYERGAQNLERLSSAGIPRG